ncbi:MULTISPECIES: spore protease YyaC [unclassified Clostridium]|uniref:spore protease YyaC n=1 Tax=unclassified Clostridium TaxID=2614128 RepID=UPI000E53BB94|nr:MULTISPECIES: spore protease YyaC [unclassified Clostridium]RHP46031.1 spore protease YyaC [Clostridium sp. AF32-12BH]RHV65692.1 spore protease YyaC [Clostridium sp. OM02-18AC]
MKKKTREQDIYYFDSREQEDTVLCASMLRQMIGEIMLQENRKGVLLFCIGTDRSTGDSLGPLIGHKLKSSGVEDGSVQIVGTLDCPVHAMNLEQAVFMVRRCYPDHVIVAVDASVGQSEHVGCITLGKGALRPGLGVSKQLQAVGDIFITGIVGGYGNYDPLMLQSVRLSVVMRMADYICASVRQALHQDVRSFCRRVF